MQEAKHMMIRQPALREYRGINYSNNKNNHEQGAKFEKEKDPVPLDNSTRHKIR